MSVVVRAISRWKRRILTQRLAQMGLCYHDVLKESPSIELGVSRLPADMQEARERRIRRAFDLSLKKMYIPDAQQQDPWREFEFVDKVFRETQKEYDERKHLNDEHWSSVYGKDNWYPYDTEGAWFWQPDAMKKRI
eukprot:gb/GECG01009908.1/.p1 GENE.gb/GECG01009908.1/~~gb/GECG01009908.1/.p1  ORF type:complete len:136 (+),score=14.81 gb/GECG01009908.1/:1-408(+)